MARTVTVTRVERYGYSEPVQQLPLSAILGRKKLPQGRGMGPGFRITVVRQEVRNGRIVNESIVCHFYNDGKNRPTRDGYTPFFDRPKAEWAAKQLDLSSL